MTRELANLHAALAGTGGPVDQLHCLYVAAGAASDPERPCPYWFGDRMTQWQMKLLTQAELATAGVALHGPWPPPGVRPVPVARLQAAVHDEITGYWHRMSRARRRWLQDFWVDHGLVMLPRAEALLTAGDLITKSEAISRLAGFGVPDSLSRKSAAAVTGSQSPWAGSADSSAPCSPAASCETASPGLAASTRPPPGRRAERPAR